MENGRNKPHIDQDRDQRDLTSTRATIRAKTLPRSWPIRSWPDWQRGWPRPSRRWPWKAWTTNWT